ncbi:MAG: SusD/RagB family nutrient-binding outer membrane lipoprotein, partial [Gammaproteobacteria bacterium]
TEDLRKIGTQKWLSLFTNGVESYMNYRRTGFPTEIGNVPVSVTQSFPLRTRYPTLEADNNTEEYDIAVSRLGKDDQTALIWLLK